MANIVQFPIDDTSPTISYEPLGDTLSLPDLNAGWNPFFTDSGFATVQGAVGNGTSLHVTARDGAKVSVTWRGTNVQLLGNVTNADYTIDLDNERLTSIGSDLSQNILATIQGLENTLHTVSLTARIPQNQNPPRSEVRFEHAVVAARPPNLNSTTPDNIYSINQLNPQSVAFHGRWSFVTEGNATLHRSNTTGDQAVARFRGTSFLLRGTTSPQAGRYSVTLNNETVSLSARSSFLSHDSLLYYATTLEPNSTHEVIITNEGEGTLSLLEGGFRVFSVGSPDPEPLTPTPPPVIVPSPTFNKGTIAAFALAGVLACLLLSGVLYYFFIYRSRRLFKRQLQWRSQMAQSVLSQTHHDKVTEAEGSVLDIARQSSSSGHQDVGDIEVELGMGAHRDIGRRGSRAGDSGRREGSGKSSFSRWRLQASTQFARESLGIQFRHSDDTNEKHRTYENTIESESDPLSSSSRSSPRFRPSLMIRKPGFLRSSQNGRVGANGNGNGGAGNGNGNGNVDRRPPSGQGALSAAQATSTAGSLSYLTAPTTTGHHEAELSESYPVAPPSYAASVLTNGGESPLSVPRSVGQSSYPTSGPVASTHPPAKGKRKSDDLLSSPNQTSGGNKTSPDTFSSDLTPPFPIRDLSKEDRGSIYDQSIDEDPKVLGGSAVRQVLRSLSPRTSKASFLPRRSFIHGHSRREASSSLEMEPMRSPTEQRPTSSAPPPPLPSPNTQASLSAAQARHESRPLPPIPQHPTINSPPPTPSQPTEPQRPEASQTTFKLTPPSASASTRFIVTPQRSNSDDSAWPSSQIASTRFSYSSGSNLHGSSPLVPDSASPPVSGGGRQSARFSALPKLPPDTAQGPSMSRRTFRLTPASFIPFPRQDPSRPSTSGTGAGTGIAGPSTGVSSTGGPTTTADDHHLHVRDSFIDFTVSSDVSTISNNGFVTDTSSAQDVRRYSTPPQMHPALPEERSRWSSSNSAGVSVGDEGRGVQFEGGFGGLGNGKGNGNSNGDGENKSPTSGGESSSSGGTQRSTRSTTFPIPVQISIPRNSQFLSPHRQVRLSTSGSSSRSDPVHVHPMMENLESPTDSIPISASDVNFTYSDDEPLPAIAQGRSRAFMDRDSVLVGPMSPFRAVPPSPSTEQHHGTHESDEAAVGPPTPLPTGLSSPNYIVQRVLGLSSPASSVTARPPGPSSQSHSHSHSQLDLHSRSRSGSTSAFFNTPLSARFETSLKGSSDPDIPRTF